MSKEKTVCYIYKRSKGFSIEKYFEMIGNEVKGSYNISKFTVPCLSGKLINMYKNIRSINNISADIIHITGDIHYVAIGHRHKKIVLTIMDLDNILQMKGFKGWFCKLMWAKLPCKCADRITTISERSKAQIIECCPSAEKKITIIGAPIDNDLFSYRKPYEILNVPNILIVGSGKRENKNHLRMIQALKGIPCNLRIIGNEYELEKKWLEENNINYSYGTNLTEEELREEYAKASLVLFASLTEGFGMIIVEAQALGRPVVTSNIEPMIGVSGNAACLVNPYDVDSIRNGVLRVLSDTVYRNELIEKGIVNAQRFTAERLAKEHINIYKDLIGD